jgi:hypothetical protein
VGLLLGLNKDVANLDHLLVSECTAESGTIAQVWKV